MGKLVIKTTSSVAVVAAATASTIAAHAIFVIVVLAISMSCGICGMADAAIESSLQYKEYWYKTEQLCPDLQEAVAGKDIDTANFPYKSVFRFMDHLQSVSEPYADLPCILEANGPKRLVSTALIEAIHVDTRPWNYTGAETCEEHIKLRLPEPTFLKRSSVPKIICRIPKSRHGVKDGTGSLYHPYVWQFQKGKLGLSFSSFNLTHIIQQQQSASLPPGENQTTGGGGGIENDEESGTHNYWLEPDPNGRQFVQIVFTTRFGGTCTIRVQQYLVDPEKTLCGDIQIKSPFRLCGVYDCSEKETILRTLGFWTHKKVHDQLDILLQSNLPRWRREEPSYLEILVSTLRALVMPLLFLSVFYVTRRLRLKLASRHHTGTGGGRGQRGVLRQRQCYLRSLMREGNNNNNSSASSDSSAERMLRPSLILNHVVYDIPVGGGEYPVYEDLPPPYESIVQPPCYHVATTQVKQASSPCPVVPVVEGGLNITSSTSSNNILAHPQGADNERQVGNTTGNISTPSANSSIVVPLPPPISSASQNNSGSRFSILDEDVMFQTPENTRSPSIANSASEVEAISPSSPPPRTPPHHPTA